MQDYTREELLQILGEHIRHLRESRQKTKTAVADLANKERQVIQKLEKGKFNPSFIFLFEIAQALELPLSELTKIDFPQALAGLREKQSEPKKKTPAKKKQSKR